MSRISDRALLRLVRDRTKDQASLPLAVRTAVNSPEAKGETTMSPSTAGLEATCIRAGSSSA